jgi:hypothetical protein
VQPHRGHTLPIDSTPEIFKVNSGNRKLDGFTIGLEGMEWQSIFDLISQTFLITAHTSENQNDYLISSPCPTAAQ